MPRRLLHAILTLLVTLVAVPLTGLATPGASMAASTAGAQPAVHPEWGSTSAADAKVKRSCHEYAYSYAITPPEGDWALETFLVGPRGKALGSGYFLTGKDSLSAVSAWRLCRHAVKGGLYTIRAKLSVQDGSDIVEGWLPDSTFRLTKRR